MVRSINEPGTSQEMLGPVSINEPTTLPPKAPAQLPVKPVERNEYRAADPDELEEELEEAEKEGDFKPMHSKPRLKRGR